MHGTCPIFATHMYNHMGPQHCNGSPSVPPFPQKHKLYIPTSVHHSPTQVLQKLASVTGMGPWSGLCVYYIYILYIYIYWMVYTRGFLFI